HYNKMLEKITIGNYVRFVIERIFRIYPLFIFILFISFALKNSLSPLPGGSYVTQHIRSFWGRDYTLTDVWKQAILFIQIPKEANLRLIPQDWTLSVEIIAGAMIPFIALLLKKTKWFYWPIIVIAIKLLHVSTYIFEFAAGIFLFYNWEKIKSMWLNM